MRSIEEQHKLEDEAVKLRLALCRPFTPKHQQDRWGSELREIYRKLNECPHPGDAHKKINMTVERRLAAR